MLKASNISKSYGDRRVLDGVTFVVNNGERLGVVAPNGAGKTTLLDILAGELAPEGGSVQMSPGHQRSRMCGKASRMKTPVASRMYFLACSARSMPHHGSKQRR